jgi:hypothetical protein
MKILLFVIPLLSLAGCFQWKIELTPDGIYKESITTLFKNIDISEPNGLQYSSEAHKVKVIVPPYFLGETTSESSQ